LPTRCRHEQRRRRRAYSRDARAARSYAARFPAHDPSWRWAAHTAPLFDINERTFASFAEWVARETGRKVVYASNDAQRTANQVTLRGSIAGLDPDTALSAVLSTTQLRRYETKEELIGIALASD
jgi:hypothetical protein